MRNSIIGSFIGFLLAAGVISACGGSGGGSTAIEAEWAARIVALENTVEQMQATMADQGARLVTVEAAVADLGTTQAAQDVRLDGLDATMAELQADGAATEADLTTLQGDVASLTTDLGDLTSAVTALSPTTLVQHVSSESDGHVVPDSITSGVETDSSTHVRQLTYVPINPHDIPLGFAVEGSLEVDTSSSTLGIILKVQAVTGGGIARGGASHQDITGTGNFDLDIGFPMSWGWEYAPPSSYTITLYVNESSNDLDATLDNVKITVWTLEGETEIRATSDVFSG